jgi:hypothetical protein
LEALKASVVQPRVAASTLQLPPGNWDTVLDCLCARFPAIPREQWSSRMRRGLVTDEHGAPIDAARSYRVGLMVRYFREVAAEAPIPLLESIVHADAHLVVADKPHFLPVTAGGRFVEETLLTRLIRPARQSGPGAAASHRPRHGWLGDVLGGSVHPRRVPVAVPRAPDRQALRGGRARAARDSSCR